MPVPDLPSYLTALAAYEQGAELYLERSPASSSAATQQWLTRVVDLLPPGAEVLELGSGPGHDAAFLEARGPKVLRTDGAVAFVDRLRAQGHRAEVLDVVTDPLPGRMDAVLACAVLLHLSPDELGGLLTRVAGAVGPRGLLAFTVKEGDHSGWSTAKLDAPRWFTYWREPALRALLDTRSWVVVDIEPTRAREDWLHVIARPLGR